MRNLICHQAQYESKLNDQELKYLLNTARKAAIQGGEILMKYYGDINTIKNKGREGDLVTNADIEAEQEIISFLKKETNDIGIYAEESGRSGKVNDLSWCIDPLDGTTNFAHGYPFFATSIGLTYKNKPLLGAICIPFLNENYWGCPGIGSYCNEEKINVSSTMTLIDSLLVTGFAYDRQTEIENNYAEFCWMTDRTRGVRRGGAAAVDMAFIANGRLDGYWERGLAKWDLAAGIPIVELAGGVISDYKIDSFDFDSGRILASNPHLIKEMKTELKKVKPLDIKTYSSL